MNNLKKVGLSALTGSLVAASASAGALDVTGIWEVTFTSNDLQNSGNAFGSKSAIMFSGSGDVDGVGTASWYAAINDNNPAGFLSHDVSIDMGDLGTFGFDQGVGAYGVGTIDDKSPSAWEESWHGTANTTALAVTGGSAGVLGYKNAMGGFNVSIEYAPALGAADAGDGGTGAITNTGQRGSNTNFAITNSTLVDGLDVGFGYGENSSSNAIAGSTKDQSSIVGYANYTMGSFTVGYTQGETSGGTAATSAQIMSAYGIAFNVNDNLSVSYNDHEIEYKKTAATNASQTTQANVTQSATGIAIAYTMGGATMALQNNEMDNVSGTAGTNDKITEISLSLSF